MNQNTPTQPVNRLYKSKIFAMLYSNKKELLELYNAISGRHYEDPELLEINKMCIRDSFWPPVSESSRVISILRRRPVLCVF